MAVLDVALAVGRDSARPSQGDAARGEGWFGSTAWCELRRIEVFRER